MKRVQISIDEELLKKIDEYAEKNFTNRSACISIAMNQYIQMQNVSAELSDMLKVVTQLANNFDLSEDTKAAVEELEVTHKVLNKKAFGSGV